MQSSHSPSALAQHVIEGGPIGRQEALALIDAPLEELSKGADAIRQALCGNDFDICSIVNGKSGMCSEDCKFCVQSGHYGRNAPHYGLQPKEAILEGAKGNERLGVHRYSIVTSGKRLSKGELLRMQEAVRLLRTHTQLEFCTSFGLLDEEDYLALKTAGVTRIHNNLETSRRFFPRICSTHTYDEKLLSVRAAQRAGLEICSGGLIGMGETFEDRVDLALELQGLDVCSVPINVLTPGVGTPLANRPIMPPEEVQRTVALFRYIIPRAAIRMAGGRGLLPDKGLACFQSGANSAISGTLLTHKGTSTEEDLTLIDAAGYRLRPLPEKGATVKL